MDNNLATLAAVASVTSDIDELYVLDQQAKLIEKQMKALKEAIANKYGECQKGADGKLIPHRGEKYGVKITIANRKGSVNLEAVIAALGLTEDQFDNLYRNEGSAPITVTCCA